MANFVNDTFTDTDGTLLTAHSGETGASWTELNVLGNTPAAVDADISAGGNAVEVIEPGADATDYVAYKASGTPPSADYEASAEIAYAGACGFSDAWTGPVIRIPGAATAVTGYAALFDPNGAGVQVWRLTGSGGTQIGSKLGGGAFAGGQTYRLTVGAAGSTITARCQRLSDGNWLTSGGTWQASQTNFHSSVDATYSAAGSAGLWIQGRENGSAGVSVDRFFAGDGVTASLSVAPSSGETGTAPTVTLTGVGTAWTGETAESLFSLSGGVGASLGTPTVNSDTEATATLTVGSAAGALTITDNSTTEEATFTATAPSTDVEFDVDEAALFWSPYTWLSEGAGALQSNNVRVGAAYAWSNQRGAYLKFRATVESSGAIRLRVNTASLNGLSANGCPTLAWSVNGGAQQTELLAYSASEYEVDLATGLAAGTYEVFVWFRSIFITQGGDEWTGPANRVQISKVVLSENGTLSAAARRTKDMVVFGDSITEGDLNMSGTRGVDSQDALNTYGYFLAGALDAEVGIVGDFGQRWSWLRDTWDFYSAGNSRLFGGLLSPAPDYVVINYGENGSTSTADVTNTLAAIAAAAPNAEIFVLVPFSGQDRAAIAAATLPDNATLIDLAPPELLSGRLVWSYDGEHPDLLGHANVAGLLAKEIYDVIGGGGGDPVNAFGTFGGTQLGG